VDYFLYQVLRVALWVSNLIFAFLFVGHYSLLRRCLVRMGRGESVVLVCRRDDSICRRDRLRVLGFLGVLPQQAVELLLEVGVLVEWVAVAE
jgi:hypothetical protein